MTAEDSMSTTDTDQRLTRAHDELHTGLDYIDEVARILAEAALNYNTLEAMSDSRLYFLANALEEASKRACEAARQIPGSPYVRTNSSDEAASQN